MTPIDATGKPARRASGRRRLRTLLMLGGIAVVMVGAAVFWLRGGRYVSTDNAYMQGREADGVDGRLGPRLGGRRA